MHRSGRAARAGKSGQAVALLGQADNANYKKIMNSLHKPDLTIWDESQPSRTVYGEFFFHFWKSEIITSTRQES